MAEALREVRYGRSGEQNLPRRAASDPGPDTREGSRVDEDNTSVHIGDIALVLGISHWSSTEMACYIKKTEGVYVSQTWVSRLWREKRTLDYARRGTTDLYAAMDIRTGKVITSLAHTHATPDFLRLMKKVVAGYPDQKVHVVLDNASVYLSKETKEWLATQR